MTDRFGGVRLTRPEPAPDRGPVDDRLYDLVEARFRRIVTADPVHATYLGIHAWDDRLGDASREAVLGELDADRRHLAAVEALDPADLSARAGFERDLEIHELRLELFGAEVMRNWERHDHGATAIGDALFPLFTRDFAPLPDRLEAIAGRLEDAPAHLLEHRTRAAGPQVRTWQDVELASAADLPVFLDEILALADGSGPTLERRLRRAAGALRDAVEDQMAWIRDGLATATDDWALGRERYDELIRLRAFDGLTTDAILEIGWEQLEKNHTERAAAAREIDPALDEMAAVDRVKSDHPATFGEALDAYRSAMAAARSFLVAHDIVSVPDDERVDVVETPAYLRGVNPFAAYFSPARWDPAPVGTYIVTSSVDGDPGAMREHYFSAIVNTSIHEAYPGHHLQLAVAARHPSLTRAVIDAPEFVEGWAMYSELMMREEGFDAGPVARIGLTTDAIWRAARIVLDIRMHRGELTVDEATDFLIEHTRFERPNALAEVNRYTSTPGYQLSYLLGKVLILGLRDEERRRLGGRFSLRAFHDTLLRNGSIPVSFHRRILHGEGG